MESQLPGAFSERMKALLGNEYDSFTDTYKEKPYAGIRVNTLKITVESLLARSPFELEPIPWCPSGFYTKEGVRPGKHPYYHAGLYYIQEPSAMAPVELLGVQPGDRVLDLCAAPGGKSTQIAARLQGEGLLVSNDLHPERTKALAKNLELYGVRNGVVLNESPERIAAAFPHFFDRILIDAPCSGEGMFRKDEDMVRQWGPETPAKYVSMQREILLSAVAALAPGGTMVYSTCTFAPEENEGSIAEFLAGHPQFRIVSAHGTGLFAPGLGELPEAARLWPHKVKGEGHFMAVLRHDGSGKAITVEEDATRMRKEKERDNGTALRSSPSAKKGTGKSSMRLEQGTRRTDEARGKGTRPSGGAGRNQQLNNIDTALAVYGEFMREQLGWAPVGHPIFFGDHLYISPLPKEALDGLKTVRPGWYVGHVRNGRFIPGHPLATALRADESNRSLTLSSATGEAVSYLKGETLAVAAERLSVKPGSAMKGYFLVCIDGYSAGWGKWQDGMLKNEYPAGWRWT